MGGNVDLIKLLVVKGADVYAENEVCKVPLVLRLCS